jgi:LSD1 subclass zinc finger protein
MKDKNKTQKLPSEVYYLVLNGAKQYFKNKEDAEEMARKLYEDGTNPGGIYPENDPDEIQDLYDAGYFHEGNDKLDHEVVNDFSIDAIKDNFTPPGAKGEKKMNKRMFAPDMLCPKCKEPMLYQAGGGRIKCSKCGNEVGEDTLDSLELYKSPNIEESEQLKDAIDTNDNGEIEEDEMADFQKSLDDYAAKNKKGREDIPATYKR